MPHDKPEPVVANDWTGLRQFTPARIALGRTGSSLPTTPHLAFQLAHARARTAVRHTLDGAALSASLQARGYDVIDLKSVADSRAEYLQRPDKGRRLDVLSRATLQAMPRSAARPDVAIVIGDGLSALAIEQHAAALLEVLMPELRVMAWQIAPLVVVKGARVAIGDEIGQLLEAACVVVLIGERPGLSSPDSLGIYLTHAPRVGLTDEARNCISNVRREGLSYADAARTLIYLLIEARKRGLSGVRLKDEAEQAALLTASPAKPFLLATD
jgi:ethanolamine ammonia-lyase small subunit